MMNQKLQVAKLFQKNLPLFNALGDSTRQKLLLLMMDGQPRSVIELTAETELSRPTISHHLKILKDTGIIGERRQGRKTYYHPQLSDYFHSVKELVDMVDKITCEEEIK